MGFHCTSANGPSSSSMAASLFFAAGLASGLILWQVARRWSLGINTTLPPSSKIKRTWPGKRGSRAPSNSANNPTITTSATTIVRATLPSTTASFEDDLNNDDFTILAELEEALTLTSTQCEHLVNALMVEMENGLLPQSPTAPFTSTLKMLPTHVTGIHIPTGRESGTFLALDLGGSNFRICLVTIEGKGQMRMVQCRHVLTHRVKALSGDKFFDFIASSIAAFLAENNIKFGLEDGISLKLGFTFSFAVQQDGIKSGKLIQWGKGFSCSGVVGQDVVVLFEEALARHHLSSIHVVALINDTVGTLISHAYLDPNTCIAVILGTGTNAAYVERMSAISPSTSGSPSSPTSSSSSVMVINTEWGSFQSQAALRPTKYDVLVDAHSENTGDATFEKMISGMYLGEIVRYILLDLIKEGILFSGMESAILKKPYVFETAYMSRIERDHALNLGDVKSLLGESFGINYSTLHDRRVLRFVCELVGKRSARLAASAVGAIIRKLNKFNACTVAIDGSLFEQYPHYGNRMRDTLHDLFGMNADNIFLEQARDGSGLGAALVAACVSDDVDGS